MCALQCTSHAAGGVELLHFGMAKGSWHGVRHLSALIISKGGPIFSNLMAKGTSYIAMASNLLAMTSNLIVFNMVIRCN